MSRQIWKTLLGSPLRSPIALLFAAVLLVQAILGAAQTARALDLASIDRQIHGTLCSPDSTAMPAAENPLKRSLPGCCLVACLSTAPAQAPSPPTAHVLVEQPGEVVAYASPPARQLRLSQITLAARPRGPPIPA
ncbi:hypothetical protein AB6806_26595 [Bosea sp. RCC_152_1]|uniref:hypothetical protein n=1 Tax=Bosea sp. RCC_152_1 TaxID=3239228 RepID=UPI0035255E69